MLNKENILKSICVFLWNWMSNGLPRWKKNTLAKGKYVFGRMKLYELNGRENNVIHISCTFNSVVVIVVVWEQPYYVCIFLGMYNVVHIHSDSWTYWNSKNSEKKTQISRKKSETVATWLCTLHSPNILTLPLSLQIMFICACDCHALRINNSAICSIRVQICFLSILHKNSLQTNFYSALPFQNFYTRDALRYRNALEIPHHGIQYWNEINRRRRKNDITEGRHCFHFI